MKKILLSCACCLLAVGLLAGCDTEEEVVNPEDPNAGVVEPGDDDGGSSEGSGPVTYKLGALDDTNNLYRWFNGEASGNFLAVTNDYEEGVEVAFEEVTSTEEGVTAVSISFVDTEGATKYISWSSSTSVNIADEPYAWYWVEENTVFAAGSSSGRALVLYESSPSFRAYEQTTSNLANPHVRVYTAEPEAPEKPEPVGTMEVVGSGVLGLYQENLGNYYYFTGEVNSSNFGVLSTSYADAVTVTEWKDDAYYYLTIGEGSSLKYIACPDTARSAMSLTSDPYCLLIDEETGAFLTGNGVEFLGTYSNYETMSWSNAKSYLGNSGQFVAELYTSEQKLDVPTSITISGASEVYIDYSITLTVTFEGASDRLDRGVTWSWTSSDSTGAITLEDGVVTGVTAGQVVVTATSTANPSVSGSITITVSAVPEFPYDTDNETEYFLGYDRSGTYYYFNGAALGTGNQAYYGGVTTDTDEAAKVTIAEVTGGYSLKCGEKYLYMEESDGHHDFKWDGDEAVAWDYDYANDVFTSTDSDGAVYYMGTSGDYNEITMNAITDIASNIPAHLIEPSAPSAIIVNGADSVMATTSVQFSVTYEGAGAIKGVTWSSSDTSKATVSTDGLVTGVAVTDSVTITATSTYDTSVSGQLTIAITAAPTYKASETIVAASVYPEVTGSSSQSIDGTSIYGDLVTISFAKNGGNNAPMYYANGSDFRIYALNTVTFTPVSESVAKISSIVFTYGTTTSSGTTTHYSGNDTATLKDASGTDAGTISKDETAKTVTLAVSASGAVTYTNYHTSNSVGTQLRITQIVINYTDPTASNGD